MGLQLLPLPSRFHSSTMGCRAFFSTTTNIKEKVPSWKFARQRLSRGSFANIAIRGYQVRVWFLSHHQLVHSKFVAAPPRCTGGLFSIPSRLPLFTWQPLRCSLKASFRKTPASSRLFGQEAQARSSESRPSGRSHNGRRSLNDRRFPRHRLEPSYNFFSELPGCCVDRYFPAYPKLGQPPPCMCNLEFDGWLSLCLYPLISTKSSRPGSLAF
ncbi:hypothetical protein QBC35DRAFT_224562 [Podospora australis]|uniref:Uncharacterized protein n=1 Tax=Podospora australis TaxID=1536484 RepID=A0AAN6X262_9PEZI|nr:hypothetical protein QBC35DRAFT_224562 [Podospora australis]